MKTIAAVLTTLAATAALVADNVWTTVEQDGRVLARLNGKTVLGFQKEPLADPTLDAELRKGLVDETLQALEDRKLEERSG